MHYPLTTYLSHHFRGHPLVLVDVGARWGLDKRWAALGESLAAYCFEPDAAECERLNAQGIAGVKFIPEALGGETGIATMYETRFSASSGLYRTNEKFFGRLLNADNGVVVGTRRVQTKTFDLVRAEYDIPPPDFVKLDVEGAEYDILNVADLSEVFGVFSEFRFHKAINGSAPFCELDFMLTQRGFMLYDIQIGRQSRKTLPYRGPKMNWASGERFYAATERGQVMDGDALYMRDPMMFKMDRLQILKAACLFELFDLKDCAAELLSAREAEAMVDVGHCLNLLAGGDYKSYLEAY